MSSSIGGLTRLSIPPQHLAGLSAGYGDEESMRLLRTSQRTRRLLLLRSIAEATKGAHPLVSLIVAAAAKDAEAVDEVLAHPFVERWAVLCLRRRASVSYLGGLAASAALRAGHPFELSFPVERGCLSLPTIGTVVGIADSRVTITGEGHRFSVLTGQLRLEIARPFRSALAHWRPAPVVALGDRRLVIEDSDPYRDCFGVSVMDRLSEHRLDDFSDRLRAAWGILEVRHPEHMRSMRESLRMIVPLVGPERGRSVSSSAKGAFGAVAVSLSMPPEALALQILHEYMHMKLWALLDLVSLYCDGGRARHFAPWRSDPRTVPALLQGAYAHVGVTDYWRVRRRLLTGEQRKEAELRFVFWLVQTRMSITTLLKSRELTVEGIQFVRGLGVTLENWEGEPVPDEIRRAALDLVTIATITWRLRNTQPVPGYATRLTRRFLKGLRGPKRLDRPRVVPTVAQGWKPSVLDELIGDRLIKPGSRPEEPAHQAFLDGDYPRARSLYRQMLRRDPENTDAWSGLALVLAHLGDSMAAGLVTARPELVRAVTLASRNDPVAIARWLGGAGSVKRSC